MKPVTIILRLAVAGLLFGMIFHLNHYSYSREYLAFCFAVIGALYPIRFSLKKEKNTLDWIKLSFVVFWSLNGIFSILHLPYQIWFQVPAFVSLLAWFFFGGPALLLEGNAAKFNKKLDLLIIFIYAVSVLSIAVGVLFKLMHWPYANTLLFGGLALLATTFVVKSTLK